MTTSEHVDAYHDVLKQITGLKGTKNRLFNAHTVDYNYGYLIALEHLESWLENQIREYNESIIRK